MCPAGLVVLGEGVNHQRLTLQLIMSLPPTPHPVEVFRCALAFLSFTGRMLAFFHTSSSYRQPRC